MIVVSLLLSVAGFLMLGLASEAHHRRRFGACPPAARRMTLRATGWFALGVVFVTAISARGWVFGPILWIAAIMAGAAIVFLALNLLPDAPGRRS